MSMQRCCPAAQIPQMHLGTEAELFKALGDPHRLTILAALDRAKHEVCVCDFTDALPLNQPTVSHHLRILREAKLISGERRGTWVYYRLAPDARDRIRNALTSVFRRKVAA
ncbi:MAG: metalloregulator ArsR/SmtB family transcription factor [Candidatus Cybelea sp.]|jgi:ArsR family transcriptional regulator